MVRSCPLDILGFGANGATFGVEKGCLIGIRWVFNGCSLVFFGVDKTTKRTWDTIGIIIMGDMPRMDGTNG